MKPECDYKECSSIAATLIYTSGSVPNNVWLNKSYRLSGTSYDTVGTYLTPKKDTYFVPDEKGFRVETERGWEEKTYTSGSYTQTEISGYYCAEHKDLGKGPIEGGVNHAKIRAKVLGMPLW